jgi:hypothetical protein
MSSEGYNTLRRKFGGDSFLVNGPYQAIMGALSPTGALRGIFSLLNMGLGGPTSELESPDPWAPTPQSLQQADGQIVKDPQPFVYSPGKMCLLPSKIFN